MRTGNKLSEQIGVKLNPVLRARLERYMQTQRHRPTISMVLVNIIDEFLFKEEMAELERQEKRK